MSCCCCCNRSCAAAAFSELLRALLAELAPLTTPTAERLLSPQQLTELARDFERFEVQVMGAQRHEALHSLLHRLQARYSV